MLLNAISHSDTPWAFVVSSLKPLWLASMGILGVLWLSRLGLAVGALGGLKQWVVALQHATEDALEFYFRLRR